MIIASARNQANSTFSRVGRKISEGGIYSASCNFDPGSSILERSFVGLFIMNVGCGAFADDKGTIAGYSL